MKKANLAKQTVLWLLVAGLIMPSIGIAKPSKTTVDVISKGEFVIFLFKNHHKDKDFQCSAEITANVKDDEGNVALHTISVWDVTLPAGSLEIEIEAGKDVIAALRNEMIQPRIVKFVENSRSYECGLKTASVTADKKVFRDRLKDWSLGPEMVRIPAGRFRMGDIQGGGYKNEQPVHWVSVNKFAMGKYEVTVGEFRQFVKVTRYKTDAEKKGGCYVYDGNSVSEKKDANWRNPYFSQKENQPVVCVSWNDAIAYAEWLSQQTGQQYRLPTEAEWEYAARAGTETKYWWGNDIGKNRAACRGCGAKWGWDAKKMTAPVGSFQSNPFGLYDTVGNVWEWTCSEYEGKYNGKEKLCLSKNYANYRVLRGGSWNYLPYDSRAAYRNRSNPDYRFFNVGLRLVRVARTS
ncbi:formylglycine-generating enzyme family protein [Candidatus Parabeggiatoa sp. HSG14]|uniref:formylglycine-generating enzyme family protein n=1 Tax=Candidatus Parabeggiatoa sp. HSG14 TaxID=3055593 RepID=UPI0025A8F850|nr:formylglycine-generating enzyme family protein [Thiotrichales bacterium HSG14]